MPVLVRQQFEVYKDVYQNRTDNQAIIFQQKDIGTLYTKYLWSYLEHLKLLVSFESQPGNYEVDINTLNQLLLLAMKTPSRQMLAIHYGSKQPDVELSARVHAILQHQWHYLKNKHSLRSTSIRMSDPLHQTTHILIKKDEK